MMTGTLFGGLVDDAALFPPRRAGMAEAVSGHRQQRVGPHAGLLGRFLCPASRLAELGAALTTDDCLRLGIVVDTRLDALAGTLAGLVDEPRLRLELVEVPLPTDADQAAACRAAVAALPRTFCFVELPRVAGWRAALDVVARAGRGAKLRTGGTTADAFPTEAEVATFVAACAEAGVPFKCTAGLHHAVRHRDVTTGFEHHGFLNILLATCAATSGAPERELVAILGQRDAALLAADVRALEEPAVARGRARFASFGSCSLEEPVQDLVALGLVQP